ncbi:MAG: hypothetical protein ACREX9_18670 [Gammaproteobacteria bacterium]
MISVQQLDDKTFKVTVTGTTTTTHTVTVEPDYCKKLTGGRVSAETLVEKSLEFLLARELNTSILRSFELPVIGRYFPEYETTIKTMLG